MKQFFSNKWLMAIAMAAISFGLFAVEPGVWTDDLAAAREYAKATDSLLLINFNNTGCHYSALAKQKALNQEEFRSWASQHNVVLVDVDYSSRSSAVQEIRKLYPSLSAFPSLIVVDGDDGRSSYGSFIFRTGRTVNGIKINEINVQTTIDLMASILSCSDDMPKSTPAIGNDNKIMPTAQIIIPDHFYVMANIVHGLLKSLELPNDLSKGAYSDEKDFYVFTNAVERAKYRLWGECHDPEGVGKLCVYRTLADAQAGAESYDAAIENAYRVFPMEMLNDGIEFAFPDIGEVYLEFTRPSYVGNTNSLTLTYKFLLQDLNETYVPLVLADSMVSIKGESSFIYDGTPRKLDITVSDGEPSGITARDYSVTYANNVNVGTATATIMGKGSYTGVVTRTFTILPKTLTESMVVLPEADGWFADGMPKRPMVSVFASGITTNDYTVAYENNVNPGTATVTITGKGNYTGVVQKKFDIKEYVEKANDGVERIDGVVWYYGVENGNAYIVNHESYLTTMVGDIAIPRKLDGYEVTGIAERAFYGCALEAITIPDCVTSIGMESFCHCPMTKIVIPDSVISVGDGAFDGCCLESIVIGNGVTSLYGWFDCMDRSRLADITVGSGVEILSCEMFRDSPWWEKQSNGLVVLGRWILGYKGILPSKIVIPDNVVGIVDGAFSGYCDLLDVVIGDNVSHIGANAFDCCENLKNIVIPDSVTSIGEGAFSGCCPRTLVVGNGVDLSSSYEMDGEIYTYSWLDGMDRGGLTRVVLGRGVTSIPDGAFAGSCSLTEIAIPDTVTRIGASAFDCCESLVAFTIPDSVTFVGEGAFDGCCLESLVVGDGVTSLYGWFDSMDRGWLAEVTIGDGVESLDRSWFEESFWWQSLTDGLVVLDGWVLGYKGGYPSKIVIPDDAVAIADRAFGGYCGLLDVVIGNGVKHIGSYAFECCESLLDVLIPDSVTSIGEGAFCGCRPQRLVVGDGVPLHFEFGMDDECYSYSWLDGMDRSRLTHLVLGRGVTFIPDGAFSGSCRLTDVTLSDAVTYIGAWAFECCESLRAFVIPDSVSYIGEGVFNGCRLASLVVGGGVTSLYGWFDSVDKNCLTNLELGDGVARLPGEVFRDSPWWESQPNGLVVWDGWVLGYKGEDHPSRIVIPDTAVGIADGAFDGYCGLQDVVIGDNVRYIGAHAFGCCENLRDVIIPDGVAEIAEDAFNGCSPEYVAIGDGVADMAWFEFLDKGSLSRVSLGDGVARLDRGWFEGTPWWEGQPDGVVTLDGWVIGCKGEATGAIALPDTVKGIAKYAFEGTLWWESQPDGLLVLENWVVGWKGGVPSEAVIPDGVRGFACDVFDGAAVESLVVGNNVAGLKRLFEHMDRSNLTHIQLGANLGEGLDRRWFEGTPWWDERPEGLVVLDGWIVGYKGACLSEPVVPGDVRGIAAHAFEGTSWWNARPDGFVYLGNRLVGLKSAGPLDVVIPAGMTYIPANLFAGNGNVRSVVFHDGVVGLAAGAFKNCSGLTNVVLGAGVKVIPAHAFENCVSLGSIVVSGGLAGVSPTALRNTLWWNAQADGQVCFGGLPAGLKNGVYVVPAEMRSIPAELLAGDKNVKRVVLHDNVTDIAAGAFRNCCALEEVVFGTGVTRLPANLFEGCGRLAELRIPDSVTDIHADAFLGAWLFSLEFGEGMTSLGDAWFQNLDKSRLARLVLGNGIATIPDYAFADCESLRTLVLADSVLSIAEFAFDGCMLERLVIGDGIRTLDSVWFLNMDKSCLTNVEFGKGITSIPAYAFAGCGLLGDIVIPDSVTSIGEGAFSGCCPRTLVVGNGVDLSSSYEMDGEIYTYSWLDGMDRGGLTRVVLGRGVTSIPDSAFSGSCSLTEITLPDTITHIGAYAFHCCENLRTFVIPDSVTYIGEDAFGGCCLERLVVGDGVTSLYGWFDNMDRSWLVDIELGDGVEHLSRWLFEETLWWQSLTDGLIVLDGWVLGYKGGYPSKIVIPDDVIGIADGAFSGYCGLLDVVIGNNVKYIGTSAFDCCESLQNIVIPDSVTSIGEMAFNGCRPQRLVVGDGVTSLYGWFDGVNKNCLTNLELGVGVAHLPGNVFRDSSWWESQPDGLVVWDGWVLGYKGAYPSKIVIPDTAVGIADYAFGDCCALQDVVIGDNVRYIGAYAFGCCESLRELIIPDGVVEIAEDAFSGCYPECVAIGDGVADMAWFDYLDKGNLSHVSLGTDMAHLHRWWFDGTPWWEGQPDGLVTLDGWVIGYKGDASTAIDLPDNVKGIAKYTFEGTAWWENQPEGLLVLEDWVIGYKGGVPSEVVIPDGVCGFADNVFDGAAVESLVVGNNVAGLKRLFEHMDRSNLTHIQLGANLGEGLDRRWFEGTPWWDERPEGLVVLDGWIVGYKGACLSEPVVPGDVRGIAAHAFEGTSWWNGLPDGFVYLGNRLVGLKSTGPLDVVIPAGMTYIPANVFAGNGNIRSVVFHDNVAVIEAGAFRNCTGLTNVVLGAGIMVIPDHAFENCVNLGSIVASGNLASISPTALRNTLWWNGQADGQVHFNGLSAGLKNGVYVIPSDMTSIPVDFFAGNKDIRRIVLHDNVIDIASSAFRNCGSLEEVVLGTGVTRLPAKLFQGCVRLAELKIPDSVTDVHADAFLGVRLFSLELGNGVTGLDDAWFQNLDKSRLARLVLGDGIATIRDYAFADCGNLRTLVLSNSIVDMSGFAFDGCMLEELVIGDGIRTLAADWFWNMDKSCLTNVEFGKGITSIPDYAFDGCGLLREIVIPDGVTHVGEWAFSGCCPKRLVVGDGVISLYGWFDNMDRSWLLDIALGVGVKHLSREMFRDTLWWERQSDGLIVLDGWVLGYKGGSPSKIVIPDTAIGIADYAFSGHCDLLDIAIGNNVKYIGVAAFECCENLRNIVIPDSVTAIGEMAFSGCQPRKLVVGDGVDLGFRFVSEEDGESYSYSWLDGMDRSRLTTVVLGREVTFIPDGAFSDAYALTDITFPDTITYIGAHAFSWCESLRDFVIPDSVTYVGDEAFRGCCLESLVIGDGVTSLYGWFENMNKSWLVNLVLGEGVENLSREMFTDSLWWECLTDGLVILDGRVLGYKGIHPSKIVIPDNAVGIADNAFSGYCGLLDVVIGENVRHIGAYAFGCCENLRDIVIPDSVTSIDSMAFEACSPMKLVVGNGIDLGTEFEVDGEHYSSSWLEGMDRSCLTNVVLGNGVTSIPNAAFYGSCSLAEITLPDTLTSIGAEAFHCCENLRTLVIPDGVTYVGWGAFSGCAIESLVVGDGLTSLDGFTDMDKGFLSSIVLGDGIKRLDRQWFEETLWWGSLTDGLVVLDGWVLGYKGIYPSKIIIPDDVIGIADYAFGGCCGLLDVVIGSNVRHIGAFAFDCCESLRDIIIPDSVVSIGERAFSGCCPRKLIVGNGIESLWFCLEMEDVYYLWLDGMGLENLTHVVLGSGITDIPAHLFSECYNLTDIVLKGDVESLSAEMFRDSPWWENQPDGLVIWDGWVLGYKGEYLPSEIVIPDTAIGIADRAFSGHCDLQDVVIGNNVRYIGSCAFECCENLRNLIIPDSVIDIVEDAFGCSPEYVVIGDGVKDMTWFGHLDKGYLSRVSLGEGVERLYREWFEGTPWWEGQADGLVMLDGWVIGYKGDSPVTIDLPDNIKGFAKYAFDWTIWWEDQPEGLLVLDGWVVGYKGESPSTLVIPDDVRGIADYAFEECYDLRRITFSGVFDHVGRSAFEDTSWWSCQPDGVVCLGKQPVGLKSAGPIDVVVPVETTYLPANVFAGNGCIRSVVLHDGVSSIGAGVFRNCAGLTNVVLGAGVTAIPAHAFENCVNLGSIVASGNLASVSPTALKNTLWWNSQADGQIYFNGLFVGGKNDDRIVIPDDMRSIPADLFAGNTDIRSIVVHNNVTNIEAGAFRNCASLEEIVLGSGVTSLPADLFQGCVRLVEMTLPDAVASIHVTAFEGLQLRSLKLGSGVTSLNADWFWNLDKSRLVRLVLGNGMTTIPNYAFADCENLRTLVLSNSIVDISEFAFDGCMLERLVIGDGLQTLDAYWFQNMDKSSFMYVEFGKGIRSIPSNAFAECGQLLEIVIPDSVTSIGEGAFGGCCPRRLVVGNGMKSLSWLEGMDRSWLTSVVLGSKIASIPDGAFSGSCSLTEIALPDTITYIGDYAFSCCESLRTFVIPDSVTYIGEGAFNECYLERLVVGDGVASLYGWFDTMDKSCLTEIVFGDGIARLDRRWFEETLWWERRTDGLVVMDGRVLGYKGAYPSQIVIPDDAIGIEDFAFSGYCGLLDVVIGNNVKYIGAYAFECCESLTKIVIPDSVVSIGTGVFEGCCFKDIVIGDGLQSLVNYEEQEGGARLLSARFLSAADVAPQTEAPSYAPIFDFSSVTNLVIGDGVTQIESGLLNGNATLENLVLGNSVTNIGENAFGGCTSLGSIEIPDSVVSVGDSAFEGCSSVTNIVIGNGLTSLVNHKSDEDLGEDEMSYGTIFDFTSVKNLTIGDGVTQIEEGLLSGCTALERVDIGNNVTNIGNNAFSGCNNLAAVSIPSGVDAIGEKVFENCGSLVQVSVPPTLQETVAAQLPNTSIVEVRTMTPGRVPYTWLEKYEGLMTTHRRNYEVAAKALAANLINTVEECYIAGLDPTVAHAKFTADIKMVGNKPEFSCEPFRDDRDYKILKYDPSTQKWLPFGSEEATEGPGPHLFKVTVDLK